MTTAENVTSYIESREYQQVVLDRLTQHQADGVNSIIELDCGLGKRVLQYLLTQAFPTQQIVIILNSTASFQDTLAYFQTLGGMGDDLGYFRRGMNSKFRSYVLNNKRVLLTTPQALANTLERHPFATPAQKDIIILNEVDSIVRRVGDSRVLIKPFDFLVPYFHTAWLVGMSATLRDSHVLWKPETIGLKPDIVTLTEEFQNIRLITMDSLLGTDMEGHLTISEISLVPVHHPGITEALAVLSALVKDHSETILSKVLHEEPSLLEATPETEWPRLVSHLPADTETKSGYSAVTLIRKYLCAMQPQKAARYLRNPHLMALTGRTWRELPETSPKVTKVVELIGEAKTVVLCSYLDTAKTLEEVIKCRPRWCVLVITGRVFDKQAVLQQFREATTPAVLIVTNVGDRDLDLPDADLLIIYDTVNTVKTVYQRMKRSRGGQVKILYHADTFEEAKVNRVVSKILERYPWSVEVKVP